MKNIKMAKSVSEERERERERERDRGKDSGIDITGQLDNQTARLLDIFTSR